MHTASYTEESWNNRLCSDFWYRLVGLGGVWLQCFLPCLAAFQVQLQHTVHLWVSLCVFLCFLIFMVVVLGCFFLIGLPPPPLWLLALLNIFLCVLVCLGIIFHAVTLPPSSCQSTFLCEIHYWICPARNTDVRVSYSAQIMKWPVKMLSLM